MFSFLRHKDKGPGEDAASLLFLAAAKGGARTVRAAVSAGADVKGRDDEGNTPLHLAARENGDPEVITVLLALGSELEAEDGKGRTAFFLSAAYNSNPAVAVVLIQAGAELSVKDSDGRTAIEMAALRSEPSLLSLLLGKGVEPGMALLSASREGKSGEAAALLAKEGMRDEAVLLAAANPEPSVLIALLGFVEDINIKDEEGRTPLMLSLRYSSEKAVGAILDKAPDLSILDKDGHSALDYVRPALVGTEAFNRLFLSYLKVKGVDSSAAPAALLE